MIKVNNSFKLSFWSKTTISKHSRNRSTYKTKNKLSLFGNPVFLFLPFYVSFNHVNNILELFRVLVPASFATKKAALKSDLDLPDSLSIKYIDNSCCITIYF